MPNTGVIINWYVYYLDHYEVTGNKVAAPYVRIETYGKPNEAEDTPWFLLNAGETRINGMYTVSIGFSSTWMENYPDGVVLRTVFSRAARVGHKACETVEDESFYEWNQTFNKEQGIREVGYKPPPDPEKNDKERHAAWEALPPLERLALSFIIAWSIIATFKAIQGFSMERFNPVA